MQEREGFGRRGREKPEERREGAIPKFEPEKLTEYRRLAKTDPELRDLLDRREHIANFQDAGAGVVNDRSERERLERDIADRYWEVIRQR